MSYKSSGVDTGAADVWVNKIAQMTGAVGADLRENLVSGVGDYAAVYKAQPNFWIAASCDGVGTKVLWTSLGLGKPEDMAQDLLAMNANDLLCVGAKPALFLDYLAVGSKKLLQKDALLESFIGGLAKHCASTGQLLVGGETAQMPDLYNEKEFDLAGFSIGFLNEADYLNIKNVQPGDEVWGWESQGPHANGFSWLRRIFDDKKDAEFISKELMRPTRLYVNEFGALRAALRQSQVDLRAAFHITGSGLLNFLRAQPEGRSLGFEFPHWPAPPDWAQRVFEKIESPAWEDLYQTFNMGIGFAVVVPAGLGAPQKEILAGFGLKALGHAIDEPCIRLHDLLLK